MRTFLLVACAASLSAAPRFEADVLPILRAKCFACHNGKAAQASLSVAGRDDLLKGGKSGAAIIPGKPVESLLLTMVSTGKMPMAGPKLSDAEILILRQWIDGGALKEGEDAGAAASLVRKGVKEREVQAILAAKCWVCHGRRDKRAGLDLRTREAILRGGQSGPAMVPGSPEQSLIVKRIAAQQMPPPKFQEEYSVRGLTDDEFEKLRQWLAAGAPADREEPLKDAPIQASDRSFWSFRPPQRPAVPAVRNRTRNPIDAFLLEPLESKGLKFADEADRRTLMRRLSFDLTGLPPAPEELAAHLADTDPRAYEKLVDRLLESPRYGERWGRYWLDAVGYSDSEGGTSADSYRPHAWRYRDYVIRAWNAGKPYDRFLTEQIAGDELIDYKVLKEYSPEHVDLLAATGFWRMAPDSTYSTEQNFIPERMDVIAGQIEVLGSAIMGLSVGCARCHDHKYDPIPQSDFYRLAATLMPAYDPFTWISPNVCLGVGANCDDSKRRHILFTSGREYEEVKAHNAPLEARIREVETQRDEKMAPFRRKLQLERVAELPAEVRADVKAAIEAASPTGAQKALLKRFEAELEIKAKDLDASEEAKKEKQPFDERLRELREKLKERPKIRALFDLGPEPPPARVLLRGDPTTPGPLVEPGALSVVSDVLPPFHVDAPAHQSKTTGRRLALAKWLTQPNHPLTARVFVNRVWQQHFGAGLVATPGNFGKMGAAPTNQKLLDWLATEFVRTGWDVKGLHRLIVTSAAYRQGGQPVRRLDSDALRDAILHVAGRLDVTPFGPPDKSKTMPDGEVVVTPTAKGYRRSVYVTQRRTTPVSLLDAFDSPFLNPNCVRRGESAVASQALHLMNSDLLRETSRHMAGRIIDKAGENIPAQIERAYLLALSRKPTAAEVESAAGAISGMRQQWLKQLELNPPAEPVARRADWLALATLCHTLLNSAEFLYID